MSDTVTVNYTKLEAYTLALARVVQVIEGTYKKMPNHSTLRAVESLPDSRLRDRVIDAYNSAYFVGKGELDEDVAAMLRKAGFKKRQARALVLNTEESSADFECGIIVDGPATFESVAKVHSLELTDWHKEAIEFYRKGMASL